MTARIVQGIGDIYWILQKIIDKEHLHIQICSSPPQRGLQVFDVVEHNFKSVKYVDYNVYENSPKNLRWSDVKDQEYVNLSANHWLDSGNRIEQWMPDEPIKKIKFKLGSPFVDSETILIYTSSKANVSHKKKGLWGEDKWIHFIRHFPINQRFHLIGAEYDRDLVEHIVKMLKYKYDIKYTIDAPLTDVLATIKESKYFLSRASGLGILGEAIGARVYMQYPLYETRLMNAWPQEKSLTNGKYIATTGKITPPQLKEIVDTWR